MPHTRRVRQVTDPLAMRALAHPLRLRLLRLVREQAPVTGAQLAAEVGESTASISYHLSILARHGFIEPDPGVTQTRRHKPWRATYESDQVVSEGGSGPLAETVEGAMLLAMLSETRRQQDSYVQRHQELPEAWRDEAAFQHTSVLLRPEEVSQLAEAVRDLIDQFDRAHREAAEASGAPESAGIADAASAAEAAEPGLGRVSVSFVAVPHVPAAPARPPAEESHS